MLPLHDYALLFPEMGPEDFEALKISIKATGQLEPVVLFERKVLDGRNRARACEALGIKPKTVDYDGADPLEYVIAKNYARRHLTPSQRAVCAERLANLQNGQRADKLRASSKLDASVQLDAKSLKTQHDAVSLREAASRFKVGVTIVKDFRTLKKTAVPELVRAVEHGVILVEHAKHIAMLPERDQKRIALTKDPQQRKQLIADAKARASEQRQLEATSDVAPLKLVSPKGDTRPSERMYSVSEWERIDRAEREAIIAGGFECKAHLNDQPSDSIEWARRSLNTVTGCLHDCPYCYARDIANSPRMAKVYPNKFAPTFHPARLSAPGNEKPPAEARSDTAFRNVFANSMSDLFGAWVPADWIEATIEMARRNSEWNFLTLTKFPQRAADFDFPKNWWMGTTIDAQARVDNAERAFAKINCGTKWLSVEPLLQPLKFKHLDLFQWIVIGGASASAKTPAWQPPMDWLVDLHAQARIAGLKIYYKTNCGPWESLRDREFPWHDDKDKSLPKSFRYLKGL